MATSPKPQLKMFPTFAKATVGKLAKLRIATSWLLIVAILVLAGPGQALAASGDGLLSYGSATAGSDGQKYRTWTPSSYGGETSGPVSSVTTNWTLTKASPTNIGIYVQAIVTTEAANNLKVYSGTTAQTSEWTATTSAGQQAYRAVDLAFENSSGQVLVIYLTSTSATTLYWQQGTWNGTDYDWTSGSTTFATTIGNLRWLRLANKLNADEMIAAVTGDDATNQVNAKVWDGSAFGNEMGANGTVNGTLDNMDAVYETSTGDGMVAWGVSTGVDSSIWSGGSWTSQAVTSTTNAVKNIALAADNGPTSDDIALGAIEDQVSDDVWGKIWGGGTWTQSTELDNNTESTSGRGIDVAYAGTTGNAILVFADSAGATLDWARSTGGGAFVVQIDYDPTPTFDVEHIIALVPDASGSNVIMDNFVDANSDLWGFYYDDDTTSWADPQGAALDVDSSGGLTYESFQFAWESVYKVPTLTEILFLILVGAAVFLGIRTGVIKIRKSKNIDPKNISARGRSSLGRKKPPIKQMPIENSRRNNHQAGIPFDNASGFRKGTSSRSIDGISRRERN